MGDGQVGELIRRAEQLRVEYLSAVNRGDFETALRVGADELVPVSEQLADVDERYYDPLGMTLMNLSAICHHLQRPITGFFFVQRAFHAATLLDVRNLPMNDGLASIASRTDTFATTIADGHLSDDNISEPESEMIAPAAALVPQSIDMMRRLDEFSAACRLRVAVTRLRELGYGSDIDIVEHESTSMVWLARFAHARGDRDFAIAEIGEALTLWIQQLDYGARFWSTGLLETWTVAAEILESLSLPESAAALHRTIEQAVGSRRGFLGLSGIAEVLDLREHYRSALAGLRPRG